MISLAILGVILSSVLIGLLLIFALGIPFFVALTSGVIVSPTDPISVLKILKRLRAPDRLSTILETEAYFNDATAVTLYTIAISLSFNPLHSAGLFGYNLGAGALVELISRPNEEEGSSPNLRVTDFDGRRLRKPGVVPLLFAASWCPFCEAFKPTFESSLRQRGIDGALVDLSDDDNPPWNSFQIDTVPTVILFRN